MKPWRRKGERFVTKVDRHEAALLRTLIDQVRALLADREAEAPRDELAELTGIRTGPSTPPDNPVLARLLPDFHRLDRPDEPDSSDSSSGDQPGTEDEIDYRDSAAALRSLHEPELVDTKMSVAAMVLETVPENGGGISVDAESAECWLAALNDVRLALGTLIGVTEEMPEQLPPDDPRAQQLNVYHWVTWMQDSLLQAMGA